MAMAGFAIAHYEVLEKLGEGGMGVIYKARDVHLDRPVALKLLPAERGFDVQRRVRFIQEAKAASALNHPNIITVYDADEDNGSAYIAMEYVRGRTLAELIPRKGLPIAEALRYAVQIADALSTAHEAGIIHRDLKPGNVMITDKGLVKVLDFGLAKLVEPVTPSPDEPTLTGKAVTEPGIAVGTPAYMAPEQAEGRPVDARADVFSFGAVLYEMVSGRRAFQKDSRASTMAAILTQEPSPLPASVPHDLERIISRCLRKDPTRRFQTTADVKVELQELKEESDSGKLTATTAAKPVPAWPRRLSIMGAAAVLLLSAAAGWFWLKRDERPVDLKPVALTAYPGVETRPVFSPDGNKVAFVWNGEKENNYDIYVKQIDSTGPPFRLTSRPEVETTPAWSPDDRWIAFQRLQADGVAIVLIPPLGGPERIINVRKHTAGGLSWTPDSKWLIYSDTEPPDEFYSLWAISIESAERRRLTKPRTGGSSSSEFPLGDIEPSVSPNGSGVALTRNVSSYVVEVWALRLTKDVQPLGEATRVADHKYSRVRGISWTGNEEIVYAGGEFNAMALWRTPLSSRRAPQRLSFVAPSANWPAASIRARRLVYESYLYNNNIWRLDTRTGAMRMLIGSSYSSQRAHYSPDGNRIAFQSDRTGTFEVWTCDSEGGQCVQLTSFGGPTCGSPRWSPDGRWLALDSRVTGQSEIYLIRADGGTPRRMTNNPAAADYLPTWSQDGRWIYFTSDRTGNPELWRMPASGGQAVRITQSGAEWGIESPDGLYLYYVKSSNSGPLFRVPAAGGAEEQVLPAVGGGGFGFAAGGLYSYATDRNSIVFTELATGKARTLARLTAPALFLDVSPDGRYVIWDQADRMTEDLMLVENFR